MKRLIEFPTQSGEPIVVEVEATRDEAGMIRAGGKGPQRAGESFEQALNKAKAIAEVVISQLRSLGELPDEMQLEFGLKMSAQAGVVLACTSVESHYKVKFTWRHSKVAPAGDA